MWLLKVISLEIISEVINIFVLRLLSVREFPDAICQLFGGYVSAILLGVGYNLNLNEYFGKDLSRTYFISA